MRWRIAFLAVVGLVVNPLAMVLFVHLVGVNFLTFSIAIAVAVLVMFALTEWLAPQLLGPRERPPIWQRRHTT